MHRKIIIGLSLISVCLAQAHQQPYSSKQQLSMSEAEQLLLRNNAQLKLKNFEIHAAQANIIQAKTFDNPEINITHNINNPVSHRYFDLGNEGETDIQLSQPIYIGGQHKNKVRKSQAILAEKEADRDNEQRMALHALRREMINLNALYEKNDLYEKEVTSLQNILSIYGQQVLKGNISKAETARIKALLFQATKDRQENDINILDTQKGLQILLGLNHIEIVPAINESTMLARATCIQDTTFLLDRIHERGDIKQGRSIIETSKEEVKLQQSNSLPKISITGEWDKNGNIGHNFFGVGLNLSIPIFNNNKGNILLAREMKQKAILNQKIFIRNAKAEIIQAVEKIHFLQQLDLSDKHIKELDQMIENAAIQYTHRNLSLLEFIDYYSSYKDSKTSVIDSRRQLLQAANDLRTATNQ